MLTLISRAVADRRISLVVLVVLLALPALPSMAVMVDLTWADAEGEVNGAKFIQHTSDGPAGSGVIDAFVRAHDHGDETGINILDPLQFDTIGGNFTRSLQIMDVPLVVLDGVEYLEFVLDIDEPNAGNKKYLSLDELKIYVEAAETLNDYPNEFSEPVYDLDAGGDNWIKLDDALSPGSGRADMVALIPREVFGLDEGKYIYLYFTCGLEDSAEGGFEEWAVGTGGNSVYVPEPATALLLCPLACWLIRRRRSAT